MSRKAGKADLSPHPVNAKSVAGALASEVKAWRYRYARYHEVYVQVYDSRGQHATIKMRVPR